MLARRERGISGGGCFASCLTDPETLLLTDRFLELHGGRAIDLASGEGVVVRAGEAGNRQQQERWAARCAALYGCRHPHLVTLLDFGMLGANRCFEAYEAWERVDARGWRDPEAIALASAVEFLHSLELSAGMVASGRLVRCSARLKLLPDSGTGMPLADPRGEHDRWHRALERFPTRGRRVRSSGALVIPSTPALGQILDWLDTWAPTATASLHLVAAPSSDVTTMLQLVGREARLRGFVPIQRGLVVRSRERISVASPQIHETTAGRHVLVLDDWIMLRDDELPEAREALSATFLELTRDSARRVRAVVAVRAAGERDLSIRLDAWPPLTSCQGGSSTRASAEQTVGDHAGPWIDSARAAASRDPVHTLTSARESTPSFGPSRSARAVSAPPQESRPDPRVFSLWMEGERLAARGRHAAAVRSLRAASCAFDRRSDPAHAARVRMYLGRLLLERGDTDRAVEQFGAARELFQSVSAVAEAASAAIFIGLTQTDEAKFDEAEATLRAACAGSELLDDPSVRQRARQALARCFYWQRRYRDAWMLLQECLRAGTEERVPIEVEQRIRILCLAARVALAIDDLPKAGHLARTAAALTGDEGQALLRTTQAAIQARLGDLDALRLHTSAGLAAARVAHSPLSAIRLRLTLAEGLLEHGRSDDARAAVRRLSPLVKLKLPGLLRSRIQQASERLQIQGLPQRAMRGGEAGPQPETAPTRGTSPHATAGPSGRLHVTSFEDVAEVLSLCHAVDDEQEALSRILSTIRQRTASLAAGFFGLEDRETVSLVRAGSVTCRAAERAIALGLTIEPHRTLAGVEAAVPVRYGGLTVGAIACRWSVEGPPDSERSLMLMTAAGSACAPLLRVMLDRRPGRHVEPPSNEFDLVGTSPAIDEIRRAIHRAANAPFAVLIEGESGCGKELVARAIHRAGVRSRRKFCPVNCAALSDDLVDAELFGHARGAFTGAIAERAGLFEEADGGTLFLDEVSELSPRAQAKLLRVIQESEVRRIGENFTRTIDVRLVAATNRCLRSEADAGRFRNDLLYRLDVIRIVVPPLREHVEDVPLLAAWFWRQATERVSSRAALSQAALAALARYDWPGNVRELQNVLSALAVTAPRRGIVGARTLPAALAQAALPPAGSSLEEARRVFERRFVRAALARTAGHRSQAAAALGLSRQGLSKLMHRLGLEPAPHADVS